MTITQIAATAELVKPVLADTFGDELLVVRIKVVDEDSLVDFDLIVMNPLPANVVVLVVERSVGAEGVDVPEATTVKGPIAQDKEFPASEIEKQL